MSIDATIWKVTRLDEPFDSEDGSNRPAVLHLKPREKGTVAGQERLTVVNPCDVAEWLVGHDIWAAGSGDIMCGNIPIGQRVGYTKCRLDRKLIAIATDDGGMYHDPAQPTNKD